MNKHAILGIKINFSNWKAFWISLIVVFIGVSMTYLGIHLPKLTKVVSSEENIVTPLPKKIDVLENMKPKLEQKQNNFRLKKEINFITPTYAFEYDNYKAYVAADFNTGKILAEKNLDRRLPVASVTKIMTAVVALDLASPDEIFQISERSSSILPTKLGMIPGQKMTLEELLNGLMLTSANDAAEVIKEGIDKKYGEDVFIRAMNKKAEVLGLSNCQFKNPQGFDTFDQYCSAGDLAVLTNYALTHYPVFEGIVKKDYQFYPEDRNHKQIDMYNWNGLLGVYPGVQGVKIGNTNEAGYTTVVVAERAGNKVIVVGLGAPGVLERDLWAAELLDTGYEKLGLDKINITKEMLLEKYSTWRYWN